MNYKKKWYLVIILILFYIMLGSNLFYQRTYAVEKLTLADALELGLHENIGIKESQINQNKAEIDVNSAVKSFLPEISMSSSYTRMFLPEENNESSYPLDPIMEYLMSEMQPSENNYQTGISLQQPIYMGGKLWLGLDQAKNNLKMTEIQYTKKTNEILYQIIESYYNILLAAERVAIEEEGLSLVREHKKTAQASYNAGMSLKTDILQIEIEEGRAVNNLETARNDLLVAKKMLGNTLGENIENRKLVWPTEEPEIKLDSEKLYELAENNRAELELMDINKDMLEVNLQIERSNHLPNIVLSGDYQWQGEEFSLKDGTGRISISASLNIFDKGISTNKRKKIEQDLKKIELQKSNVKELMNIEIEDLLLSIKENKRNIELQEMNLNKAEENLELENKRYEVGTGTNVDVMDAQMVLRQTKIARMQAEHQYKINLYKLLQKTGKITEYCREALNNG
ncbi:MAG: TolC family protein [Bacillota bacterium]